MTQVAPIFAENGNLAGLIPGYRPREPQLEMALAVENTIENHGTLVAEAETGTGKTLAYLIPALLSEGPTIVSTGTKSLQDQLFFKDLPLVLKALGVRRRVALLKGRGNYLCQYRLKLHEEDSRFMTRETVLQFQAVSRWAERTSSGDIAELLEISEDATVWPFVTSTTDNCLGQDCPCYSDCSLVKARKEALQADLVVVNHHLFFADAALKGEGLTDLLPGANTVIFDEAHQLPDVAAVFFGETLSARQLQELCRDLLTEAGTISLDIKALKAQIDQIEKTIADLRIALGEEGRRAAWAEVADDPAVIAAAKELQQGLTSLAETVEPHEDASRGMESCVRRLQEQKTALAKLLSADDDSMVYWFENFRRAFVLHATPLTVAEKFDEHRNRHQCAWIFTSATLSVAGNFAHFLQRLGLESAETLYLQSPFDFGRQAVFYVPENLPMPNAPDYTRQLVEAMIPVIEAARGRTFFLFTSHRALREAAQLLRERISYPLLVQGEAGRRQLLDDFREKGNAVLLGAASFWEGIDVRGDNLSCVIIDKLPFASPADPVAAARIDRIKQEGGQPFREYQLPQAVLSLRQGAGRLIRDPEDRGLLVMGDQRLIEKGYGKTFLNSLPGMTRTRKLDVVQRFFRLLDETRDAS